MAPYAGNTVFVTEEELEILSASLNNLKIFSAVIDKLAILKKGVVVAKDEDETDWFSLQEELADCICQLQAVENTDHSYPMLEAKKSLMEEVAALKKIVDEVCEVLASDQLAVTALEYENTGQQQQTSQTESQCRRINWYSVEKKHDSAGSCEQEIQYRMVGRQRSDLSTERERLKRSIDIKNSVRCTRQRSDSSTEHPKPSIDIKNSVRCRRQRSDLSTERPERSIDIKNSVRRRRENRVCEIERKHSNEKDENVIKWVFVTG